MNDLFDAKPPKWREQDDIARKIGRTRSKVEKKLLARALCHSLVKMTEKPRLRN